MRIIDNDKMILTIIVMIIRFYMVTGEKGWLPYGTDCSGEAKREAYCVKVNLPTFYFCKQSFDFLAKLDFVQGRCLEFGNDGTPLYVAVPGGSLGDQADHFLFKRAASDKHSLLGGKLKTDSHQIIKRSLILNTTSRVAGSIDQEYLEQIVNDFNRSLTHKELGGEATVNFDDPIDVDDLPLFDSEDAINDVDYKVFPREDIDEDLDNSDDFPVDFDIIYDKPTSRAFCGRKVNIFALVFLCTLSFCLSSSIYFPSSKTLHGNKSKTANKI